MLLDCALWTKYSIVNEMMEMSQAKYVSVVTRNKNVGLAYKLSPIDIHG